MEKAFILTDGERKIPCRLAVPEYGQIRRVVLGVHGFGGSADDAIQASIAEEMEFFSSVSLRFDFPAHGRNPQTELRLSDCIRTLLSAARYAKESYPEVEDLCIFASGFGAYVTMLALDELLELPGKVKLVVQTPSVRMHETLLAMTQTTQATFWAMDRLTLHADRPFDVTYRFYEELQENIALTVYPIPMLILQGEDDDYIRMSDIQQLYRLNEGSKLVVIPGASHRFLEDGAWDMVLDLTRDWFEFEQVLLSDWV